MVEVWWSLLGAAIPAIFAGQAWRIKRRRDEEQRIKSARGREKSSDDIFVCERICMSKRMLKKVGAFSKDPIPDTCVTVCGVSELDACTDACARTVCVNQHHVPNWNDVSLRRCQSECLKLSASRSSYDIRTNIGGVASLIEARNEYDPLPKVKLDTWVPKTGCCAATGKRIVLENNMITGFQVLSI
ncbi:uncharacterized protein At5g64816-like [Spinacia oleracea]|uniref:Uncharacterized protein At5g64816-like n=1 Tax=Spinacia oleracea TaxID=3562 RepID=A0A9R0J6E7_SPIOL|nr:uncharacterized protein At5g64816-like [Spinacia oleracea]